jgi:hypothetical protein
MRQKALKARDDATALLAALDDFERQVRKKADRAKRMPRAKLVVEAFKVRPMSEKERKVIQVLLDHPRLTSTDLGSKIGWGGQAWHMHFGSMCRDRISPLWPPQRDDQGTPFYTGLLADWSRGPPFRFTMNPEAVEGFAQLGLRPARSAGT